MSENGLVIAELDVEALVESLDGMDEAQVTMVLDRLASNPCKMADAIGDRISKLKMLVEDFKRDEAILSAKRQGSEETIRLLKAHMLTVLDGIGFDAAEGERWEAVKYKTPDKVVLDVDVKDLPDELTRMKREANRVLIKAALKEHFEEMDGIAHLEHRDYVRLNGRHG